MNDQSPTAERPPKKSPLLGTADLALELGISEPTVRRNKDNGKLPAPFKVGGLLKWRRKEIEAWLDAGCPDIRTWEAMKKQII